ncbi:MAG: bifunctional methionine sulfoxide reductase B/A protein [Prevotellaceae bacterium]|jgi:peptide methionine sulfoxide reductase msrA/msrB|nr:bifunctional methionine sulfoxide reductase B/A protein [Prevotellaceae bacterium]
MKIKATGWSFLLILLPTMSCNAQHKTNPLTPEEERVIIHKGTEALFTGEYYMHKEEGVYIYKYCNAILFRSSDKFESSCGWPSFDNEVSGAVKQNPDSDGKRVEILCNRCGGHLGHIFTGERLTPKNIRYCVNSISLNFIPISQMKVERAYFAAGCFWGVQHYLNKAKGVIETTVGYMGGKTDSPTYKEVCSNTTGHAEVIEVVYDPLQTSFEELAKLFFEIHDPTQINRQGPDIGEQYRSEIFYQNEEEKKTAEKLMQLLYAKGIVAATLLEPATTFWKAEDYHQHYYEKNGKMPYCHTYTKRF